MPADSPLGFAVGDKVTAWQGPGTGGWAGIVVDIQYGGLGIPLVIKLLFENGRTMSVPWVSIFGIEQYKEE